MVFPVRYDPNDPERVKSVNAGRIPLWLGFEIERLHVTPEMASEFLKKLQRKQRPRKSRHFEMLKTALSESFFFSGPLWNGAVIMFDTNDHLIDGQHRLLAIVETKVAADLVILYGLDPRVFPAIDSVARRTGGDTVGALGISNANAVAGACKLAIRYDRDMIRGMEKFSLYEASPVEIDQYLERYPGIATSVSHALSAATVCHSPTVSGFCHWMYSRISKDAADRFIHKLATGEMLRTNDPIYVLRKRLEKGISSRDTDYIVHLLFKTWNLWRKEKTITSISIRDGERLPKLI